MTNSYGSGGYDIMFIELTDIASGFGGLPGKKVPATTILNGSPNPFSEFISIHLFISGNDPATLAIVDLRGQVVKTYPEIAAGYRFLEWDGLDDHGHQANAGIYFLVLKSKTGTDTRKIMLINSR